MSYSHVTNIIKYVYIVRSLNSNNPIITVMNGTMRNIGLLTIPIIHKENWEFIGRFLSNSHKFNIINLNVQSVLTLTNKLDMSSKFILDILLIIISTNNDVSR